MKKWLMIVGGVATSVVSAYAIAWLGHCCRGAWHEMVTGTVLTIAAFVGIMVALSGAEQ